MMKKRSILKNNSGVTNTIESLIAIGITITLVFVFCYSVDTHYNTYDNKTVTLRTQNDAISGSLISLQGLNSSYGTDWENGSNPLVELRYLGFATNPMVEYGVIDKTTSSIKYGPYPQNYVGQTKTCFLAGTKIVMADGTYKDIERIAVGEKVKSFNEKKGQTEDNEVIKIFHHLPEEMGDYYLIINNYLRVTPNHQFYTEKGWIAADSLQIGDKLSYSSEFNAVYSIEKVYKKVETYNLEVEGNHNYFVDFDFGYIIAHNGGKVPDTLVANFTWFDRDGMAPSKEIYFKSTSGGSPTYYTWQKSTDGITYNSFTIDIGQEGSEVINQRSYVKLTVTKGAFSNSTVKIVEANKLGAEPDPAPWVLTGKNENPDTDSSTLPSYGEGYYVTYYETSPISNFKVYEVKSKKSPEKPCLSSWKIDYVDSLSPAGEAALYQKMKGWLGLTSDKSIYNFHIKVYIYDGVEWTPILDFGDSDQYVNDKVSVTRQVSIYTPPSCDGSGNIVHPTFHNGKIIISTFIG